MDLPLFPLQGTSGRIFIYILYNKTSERSFFRLHNNMEFMLQVQYSFPRNTILIY